MTSALRGDLRRYAAANARVRVWLSTLLGRRGLEVLCGYPSAAAVLDALARTPYGVAAGGLTPTDHNLLMRLGHAGRILLDLLVEPERTFVRLYLLHYEIANLKVVIRAIAQRLSPQSLTAYLDVWPGIATVAPLELARAHDLRTLVERLADTPYGAALAAALHRAEEAGAFAIEVALELDYYERLWAAAATLRRADRERAEHLLGILFDILTLSWISRYHAAGLSAEEILNYTLRQGCWLTPEIRRRLAETRGAAWTDVLARTPYAALLGDVPTRSFDAVSVALWRFLAGEIHRSLRGYPFQIGVPLGFLLLQEIEIRDLRVLLVAKGIGVPGSDILERLATSRN